MRGLIRDEKAQASVEYLLMMLVAVTMVMLLIQQVIRPVMARLKDVVAGRLERALFGGGSFHRLNIGGGS